VDFGGVDLDLHAAKTMRVSIENSGNGTMEITDWPALTGGLFMAAAGPKGNVLPDAQVDLDVSYLPTAEKTVQNQDTADLLVTIDGLIATGNPQPSQQKITLTGHGIDRHMSVDPTSIDFPDTYENLSDDDDVRAVTVRNTGEAPLAIKAVMLS